MRPSVHMSFGWSVGLSLSLIISKKGRNKFHFHTPKQSSIFLILMIINFTQFINFPVTSIWHGILASGSRDLKLEIEKYRNSRYNPFHHIFAILCVCKKVAYNYASVKTLFSTYNLLIGRRPCQYFYSISGRRHLVVTPGLTHTWKHTAHTHTLANT